MGLVSGIAVYFMIWWTLLFVILPWGVRPEVDPEHGQMPGAPRKHHMKRRIIVNTILSAVLWLVIYVIIDSGVFSFRSP